ncbi:hypothetical protein BLOT_004782 [Blomia tropicalis]|nr:hypothetical protein BLOT_004782 [Blomia tropicalis]
MDMDDFTTKTYAACLQICENKCVANELTNIFRLVHTWHNSWAGIRHLDGIGHLVFYNDSDHQRFPLKLARLIPIQECARVLQSSTITQ